ncbi:hypothetical protein ODV19_03100 [Lactobacillus amylovorus]|uniref:Uncharacterized protein n=1 Tax=Lactobacillus amylovorus TaxID=1604 RepID=A0AAW6B7F0_LACAM|nr:hypothetical protein [Lactobacillus amylovorus]MDA6089004.1 hypothetical protein [Lactobacillus amylovorus]MDB6239922.1 hypothetical protein [Lactobacillus amylovorus]MDB6246126.1 hypothetical protein [Lactobacillus amylovorus]
MDQQVYGNSQNHEQNQAYRVDLRAGLAAGPEFLEADLLVSDEIVSKDNADAN